MVRTVWIQRTAEAPYTTRLTRDTGCAPAFDVDKAVADYVAWRADNAR
jgi:hypothetical protein